MNMGLLLRSVVLALLAVACGNAKITSSEATSSTVSKDEEPRERANCENLVPELDDGLDSDCDGDALELDLFDQDGDGFTAGYGSGLDPTPDCDDANAAVNPGATEILSNQIDDDCDPSTPDEEIEDLVDADGDGDPADTDCDDNDASRSSRFVEILGNAIDDDCDVLTLDTEVVVVVDLDNDGDPAGTDCDDTTASRSSLLAEVYYNGIDDDCDAETVDDDQDGDADPVATDCDDTTASRSSLLAEVYYNGIDDDCDAETVDDDQDGDADPVATDCDDTTASRSSLLAEVYYNGIDDDCDAETVDDDQDGDDDPVETDCDDTDATVRRGVAELDNGIDNDCDGDALEIDLFDLDHDGYTPGYGSRDDATPDCDDSEAYAFPGAAPLDSATDCMLDTDRDGYGSISVSGTVVAGTDCDDGRALSHPGAPDSPDNGIDDDCIGGDLSAVATGGLFVDSGDAGCVTTSATIVNPYCEISDALSEATTGDRVYVAAGDYGVISASVQVELYGGFDSSDGWSRNAVDHPSRILSSTNNQTPVVLSAAGSDSTVLDGFVIERGAWSTATSSRTGLLSVSTRAVVQNNDLREADISLSAANYASIRLAGPSVEMHENTISGGAVTFSGTSTKTITGLVSTATELRMLNNTMTGISLNSTSASLFAEGLNHSGSNLMLVGNTIHGSAASVGGPFSCYAVHLAGGAGTSYLDDNTIACGDAVGSGFASISSNTIKAVAGESVRLTKNSIDGGNLSGTFSSVLTAELWTESDDILATENTLMQPTVTSTQSQFVALSVAQAVSTSIGTARYLDNVLSAASVSTSGSGQFLALYGLGVIGPGEVYFSDNSVSVPTQPSTTGTFGGTSFFNAVYHAGGTLNAMRNRLELMDNVITRGFWLPSGDPRLIADSNVVVGRTISNALATYGLEQSDGDAVVLNNTFDLSGSTGSSVVGVSALAGDRVFVANNIFVGSGTAASVGIDASVPASLYNNLFVGMVTLLDAESMYTTAEALNGCVESVCNAIGGNIASSDAQFLDANNGDYRIAASSPAVDTGADLFGVLGFVSNTDIEKQTRPFDGDGLNDSEFDIGFDEYRP